MSQINKPNTYFNTVAYTGNGVSGTKISLDFAPDMVWTKSRSLTEGHSVMDTIRGVTKHLIPNGTNTEGTDSTRIISFDSDGYQMGTQDTTNLNSATYVSWSWKGGGTAVSNTDGSITSSVSANTTSGFSIVSWTGNQTAGASCGHGLGVAPSMIIKRRRNGDGADYWYVYHKSLGSSNSIYLNTTDASGASGAWNSQTPTSTVFYHGSSIRENGNNMIAYCFAEKKGFSKFGSYTGNGSTDGTFVYTGFKPAFVIAKNATTGATSWEMADNKRALFNVNNKTLKADTSGVEQTYDFMDFLSNGFKLRYSSDSNTSGNTIIYMAFAENPLVGTNNIPACAR